MTLLQGKVAFITGGARGQGRAHAVRSAEEGADVVLLDIVDPVDHIGYPTASEEDMAETVRLVEKHGRQALPITGDVRSQSDLDDAVARGISEFGKIDILIANAGIWGLSPFWEMDEATWSDMIDINLTGVYRSARAVAPHMIGRGSGSIVMTSSTNGLEPASNYAHYIAAKHGVVGLMKAVALELAPHGIRCNAISPGAIATPMIDNQTSYDMFSGHVDGTREEWLRGGSYYHALKGTTMLPPEVIADAAVFLNSNLAAAVTGVVLPVDAGHLLMPGVNPSPVS